MTKGQFEAIKRRWTPGRLVQPQLEVMGQLVADVGALVVEVEWLTMLADEACSRCLDAESEVRRLKLDLGQVK